MCQVLALIPHLLNGNGYGDTVQLLEAQNTFTYMNSLNKRDNELYFVADLVQRHIIQRRFYIFVSFLLL